MLVASSKIRTRGRLSNARAIAIIETQPGKHPVWILPYRGKRLNAMNNTAWRRARRAARLADVRVHNSRHNSRLGIMPLIPRSE